MTTFTVVTVTWQAAETLPATLDSVARQTHPYIEHLIIDGVSTDGTVSVASDYRDRQNERDGRHVVIVSEPDRGLYDAMNKGLARATGDYVVFLNAGDRLAAPDTLARVAAVAESRADGDLPGVIYGDTHLIDADGHDLGQRRLRPPRQLTWRSFRQGMLVCHQAFYARTDIARHLPYNLHYRYSADVDWCIRVMKEAERQKAALLLVDEVVALFLEGGQTTAHHRDSLKERFQVMRHHYGLPLTLLMHGWFAIRNAFAKLQK